LTRQLVTRPAALLLAGSLLVAGCGAPAAASPPPAEAHTGFEPLEVKVDSDPDWLAAGFGSVWLKRPEGFVDRIDAATGSIVARIETDATPDTETCDGIGQGSDAIWSCSFNDLVRIDPTTSTVSKTIAAGKIVGQGRIVAAAGRIWVLTGNGDQLVGIAEQDGSMGAPIALPVACSDLAAVGDIVYAGCERGDRVLRIDPATSKVTVEATIKQPVAVTAAASGIWVSAENRLLRLDPTTLTTTHTIPGLSAGSIGGIRADDTGIWVRTIKPFLTRVDANGVITRVIESDYASGGDVVGDGTYVWTTDIDERAVVRLKVPERP
jgi:outer membrane protein assembly factor BamB